MARSTWNSDRFAKWQEETHIPEDVMKMVEIVSEQIGVCVEEKTIEHRDVGGYRYAFSKGFVLSHCTSSIEDGPSEDMTTVFMRRLRGLGFYVANSHGDDTCWYNEIFYDSTFVNEEDFWDWHDSYDD